MRVVVYGSRPDGHANVVLEVLLRGTEHEVIGLLDDREENADRRIGELAVIGGSSDLGRLAADGIEGVILGFGAARGREAIVAAAEAANLELPTLAHRTAHVEPSARRAAGTQILAQAYVGPNADLGRGCLVNTGAIVEHDVALGDGSVVDPGAVLAGRVRIGREVEIGSGAVLIPDVEVGDRATVGAGAVVVSAVEADQTVVGVPARPLARG